ncbi:ATP-dependent Clp protease proteolytic subunit [Steroidobacter sp. S1-65]|uniref:ATP-dependent Clp protease proteolytic subunit n=1 Tax=Steroidobacter gossypii TaxID=2805490 RepID=A0ABS1WUQ6_9GAMM|nr:ATP-dependent Clp protease proteolytic subunit [Steroidobacter gossypii]MBM0104705.1 ATP-dependent Clp protease proteolytic subunit [Steroidobacter gossypii]
MNRALKVVNGILLALFALAVVGAAMGGGLGGALPASIWLVVPFLTMRAADQPSGSLYGWAFGLNVFGLFCFAASTVALFLNTGLHAKAAAIALLVALFAAPFAWNLYALRKVKAEDENYEPSTWEAAQSAQSVEAPASRNYFIRHWRGELSLPISYWVNGSLLGLGLGLLFLLMAELAKDWELRTTAFVMLGLMSLLILVTIWSTVGILRSANQHASRGGSAGWAIAAQVVTCLSALSFVARVGTQLGPQMGEFASIAFNYDSLKRVNATLSADGTILTLQGTIGTGSYEYVHQVLGAAPEVRTIVLDSQGGRIREAEQLAEMVRDRGLDTYVEGQCASACTYLFLAGKDRAATPNAKIGFHRPSFAGTSDYQAGLTKMLAYYRTAGISEPFLDRIRNTKSEQMWYPSRDELIDNGVLTRVSLGGEAAMLAAKFGSRSELEQAYRSLPLMQAMDRRFPGTVDQAIDAAWAQYQSGARDGDISAAARRILSDIYPQLLATADDAGLEAFLNLSIRQLSAASELGADACGLFLDSKLDVTKVFAPELIEEEMQWSLSQLAASPVPRATVSAGQFQQALLPVAEALDPSILDVVAAPEQFADEPHRRCTSTLAFYEAVASQPATARAILLRGMFQSGDE